jgi:hypothetical protein
MMTVRRLPRDYITRAYADDGGPACDAPRSVNSPPGRQRLDIGSDDLDPLPWRGRTRPGGAAEEERHHEPAAVEDDRFDRAHDLLHAGKAPERLAVLLFRTERSSSHEKRAEG